MDRRRRQPVGNVTPLHGWWTTSELAYRLSFSTRTLQRWRSAGTGPPWYRVGRHVRYDLAQVNQWIADHTVYPLPPAGWPRRRLLHLLPPPPCDAGDAGPLPGFHQGKRPASDAEGDNT